MVRTSVSSALAAALVAIGAHAVSAQEATGPKANPAYNPAEYMKMFMPSKKPFRANTMMPSISREAKMKAAQSGMLVNPFSLRDMINMMVHKVRADEGLSFDEVIESLKLKANELNFKLVGHNTPYKLIGQITGKDTPRVEILSFCDVITMRQILDYSPEFIAFLPCRVGVLEDADKKIWLVTLDWDVRWLDTSPNPNKISDELRKRAMKIRDNLVKIMEAGAHGDL